MWHNGGKVAENGAQSISFHIAKDLLYHLLKTFTILFKRRPIATQNTHTNPGNDESLLKAFQKFTKCPNNMNTNSLEL